jgi:alkanesulfonate monooxygenase SsuD/methylene tetrahydromethanopterin reductase-like flavin-dependent oxidoreductase (luciferase family)
LPEPGAQAKYYQEALQQVLWAEQLGFDSVWFTEHHFSRHGIVPASLTLLAYLAGVTTSIRLGTAVAVLPFHNPIRLAEEAAMVDVLSHGRLDLGVGVPTSGRSFTSTTFLWRRRRDALKRRWK